MALTAGSVTVADDGSVTKSGAAGRLYDILLARAVADATSFQQTLPSGAAGARVRRSIGNMATDIATWMVTELTTNARARITTSDVGLQRMPASTAEDTNCKAPATEKLLGII